MPDFFKQLMSVELRQVQVQKNNVGSRRPAERTLLAKECEGFEAVLYDTDSRGHFGQLQNFTRIADISRVVLHQEHVQGLDERRILHVGIRRIDVMNKNST